MVQITIDTEKESQKSIMNTIRYLQTLVDSDELDIRTTHSEPSESTNFFNNGLPSSGPQVQTTTSANDLLNMCDDEEDTEEIKPSEGLTDFSQFIPF